MDPYIFMKGDVAVAVRREPWNKPRADERAFARAGCTVDNDDLVTSDRTREFFDCCRSAIKDVPVADIVTSQELIGRARQLVRDPLDDLVDNSFIAGDDVTIGSQRNISTDLFEM